MKKLVIICIGAVLLASCAPHFIKVEIVTIDPHGIIRRDTVNVPIQQPPSTQEVRIMKTFWNPHWRLVNRNKTIYQYGDTVLATSIGEVTIKKARVISYD